MTAGRRASAEHHPRRHADRKRSPASPLTAGGRADARGAAEKEGGTPRTEAPDGRGPPGGTHWIDRRLAPATAFFGSVSSSTPFSNFAAARSSSISSVSAKLRANAP